MFNLEQSIAAWREQMLAAGIQTPVPLDELELHIREEFERQLESGAEPETAFRSSLQTLGPVQVMKNEFEKVDGRWGARKWKLMEFVLLGLSILMPLCVGSILVARASHIDLTAAGELSSLAAVASFSLFAWVGRIGIGILPVVVSKRKRDVIGAAGGGAVALWWIIFLRVLVPRHDFTVAQFIETFVWAWFPPAGVWVGLFWGLEAAARKRATQQMGRETLMGMEFAQVGETGFERVKRNWCVLAGIPSPQLTSNMNIPSLNPEPRWATYFRSSALILPALFIWIGVLTFVVPKLKEVCATSGTALPKPVLMALSISDLARENFILGTLAVLVALTWLECRSHRWPRYRRLVFGIAAFSLNLTAFILITIMMIFAVLAATNLLHTK